MLRLRACSCLDRRHQQPSHDDCTRLFGARRSIPYPVPYVPRVRVLCVALSQVGCISRRNGPAYSGAVRAHLLWTSPDAPLAMTFRCPHTLTGRVCSLNFAVPQSVSPGFLHFGLAFSCTRQNIQAQHSTSWHARQALCPSFPPIK